MSTEKLLQQTDEPAFLLDRRRRVRFVNRAWEALTGHGADSIVGLSCVRKRSAPTRETEKLIAIALRPPCEAIEGRPARARRAVPPDRVGPPWWDIAFFPLLAEGKLIAILGKITTVGEKRPKDSPERLAEPMMALRETIANGFPLELARGDGPAMRRVTAQVRAACSSDVSIWLTGPPGSGKQTLARVIHHNGRQRERTFAAIDCGSLPAMILRGMLFGQSGLATSQRVGTLYLNEPGRLPGDLQSEILEWASDRDTELPRILVGTCDPPSALAPEWAAEFGVLEIHVPPLSQRPEDFSALTYRLLERTGAPGGISPEALELLRRHHCPENLRELASILRSAASEANGSRIEPGHVPRHLREAVGAEVIPDAKREPFLNLDLILEQVERRLITQALERSKGNQTEAAERLGIWRARLGRRIDALKIEIPNRKPGSE